MLRARSFLNSLAFSFRSRISWARKYSEGESFDASRLSQLLPVFQRYGFDSLSEKISHRSLLLNLAKADQLDRLFRARDLRLPARPLRALDVGSQNFVYAPALSLVFSRWGTERPRTVELSGIEIDANRRYWALHTRRSLARYYASLRPWTVYLAGDFCEHPFEHRFDAITMFRPHLDPEPLARAGLPLSLLQPERIFRRGAELLNPGGILAISYQSEAEAEMGQAILKRLDLRAGPVEIWNPPEDALERKPQWLQMARKEESP